MEGFLRELLSAVIQLLVVFLLVFFCWLGHKGISRFRKKDSEGLRAWIGLKMPSADLKTLGLVLAGVVAFSFALKFVMDVAGFGDEMDALLKLSSVNDLAKLDPSSAAIFAGLTYAFIKTAGSEELLFKGLLYKRFLSWFGYLPANLLQSFLFGVMHNGIIYLGIPEASLAVHANIFLNTFVVAYLGGWYMEKKDGGSLFFPWLVHGLANFSVFLSSFWV